MSVSTLEWFAIVTAGSIYGGASATTDHGDEWGFYWGYSSPPGNKVIVGTGGGGNPPVWGGDISVGADALAYGRAYAGSTLGSILSAKANANPATAQTPTSSA